VVENGGMIVAVLNGSPKGALSVSYQYARYVMRAFPEHEYRVFHLSAGEGYARGWMDALAGVGECALLLWVSPVYCFLVPAQVKEFIEWVEAQGQNGKFAGKVAASLFSSIHFFDHTALRYLQAVSEDLGMRFAGAMSFEMYDLLQLTMQERLRAFASGLFQAVEARLAWPRAFARLSECRWAYEPAVAGERISFAGLSVVVVTDGSAPQGNLPAMLARLTGCIAGDVPVLDLQDLTDFPGCCGTVQCGLKHECVHGPQDGFVQLYRERLMKADVLFFAGCVRDRFLSHRWKRFLDRSLFHGHEPSLAGKQIGWLVAGPLGQVANLRDVLEAASEGQMAHLLGIVSDEEVDSPGLDATIAGLVGQARQWAGSAFVKPPTFLGIGDMMVLKHIVVRNRFLFQADARFFRSPRVPALAPHTLLTRFKNVVLVALLWIPAFRRFFLARFPEILLLPFRNLPLE